MTLFRGSKLTSFQYLAGILVLILTVSQLCAATEEEQEGTIEKRSFFGLFGPRPLPGDGTSPVVCGRYCRNRCLNGGYSGFLGVPGCNQFCDCSYYFRPY